MTTKPSGFSGVQSLLDTDILDLRELLQIAQRRWLMIGGVTLLAIAITMVITVNITKLYTATAVVLIENRESRIVDLESVMSGLPGDSSTIESQVEILRSQSLAARLVDELDLISDPEFNRTLRDDNRGLLHWLDPRTWIRAILSGGQNNADNLTGERAQARIRNSVVSSVQDRLQVRRRGLTLAIEIKFTSQNPDKASDIANAMADLYIVDQLEARYEATRRANEWLSERLEDLRELVRQAETEVATFASANNLVTTGERTVTEQQLSEINEQLIAARADLSSAEVNYSRVRQIVQSGGDVATVSQIVQSPSVASLRTQEATLRRQEAEFAGRYGDRHPDLINVREEIREVQLQLRAELSRIVSSLENEVDIARNRVTSLEDSLRSISAEQAEANQSMVRLRELQRNAESQRTLYESFLLRFNETTQQEDLQTSDARIIAEASPPQGPSHPRAQVLLVLGAVVGVGIGCGIALLLEWLDRGLRTREQLEAHLNLPQLAAIPMLTKGILRKLGPDAAPEDFVNQKPLSTYTESIRTLRTGIDLSNIDTPPKVVLVTSALPNEGKTTIAISLARQAANAGQKTLLIDGDMRHPTVHHMLGIPGDDDERSLVGLLAGNLPLGQAIRRDETQNLFLLLGGRMTNNPSDLLESARMREFLKVVRQEFDLVVIDAAPVLPVVDTRVLSRLVDTTVYVVRWHDTPRDAAKEGLRYLRDFNANVAGAALSLVDMDRQRRYGYSSSYYYYGRYREYYAD